MTVYDKDSTVTAVVLYEHANSYIDSSNNYETRTDFYYRIKILDKTAFNLADITLHLFEKKRLKYLKATTYNLSDNKITKNHLLEKNIYTIKEGEH
ncbi:hypothetical protein [Polaribacter sp. IC073]|uniref:hypothetical protein n=1 Tax=Polaribacter sp. IC073 TaxID=2508540 RepID=UPI001CB8F135|nr:hypothetical protein [Polaribacter sp. IC073]